MYLCCIYPDINAFYCGNLPNGYEVWLNVYECEVIQYGYRCSFTIMNRYLTY